MITFDEHDLVYVEEAYRQLMASYDDERLRAALGMGCKRYLPAATDTPAVAALVKDALKQRAPFSLVRVGDGEGNVLALLANPADTVALKCCNALFYLQDRACLSGDEAAGFATELAQAVFAADAVGIRSLYASFPPESVFIRNCIDNDKDIRGAVGILRARQFVERATLEGAFRNSVITFAWIHLSLLEHLEELLDAADSVVVVAGRQELANAFEQRLGTRLRQFLSVPIEASFRNDPQPHYPEFFNSVKDSLRGDLGGALVLVGAGIFGKVYCDVAKQNGGVALDLGSAFDVLANKVTRPSHSHFKFSGLDWIPSVPSRAQTNS